MILSPKHLPRLASTLGLFTNYGLRDFAKRQGLMSLDGANADAADESADGESAGKARAFREKLVELSRNLRMTNKKGRLLSRPFLFRVRFRPT